MESKNIIIVLIVIIVILAVMIGITVLHPFDSMTGRRAIPEI